MTGMPVLVIGGDRSWRLRLEQMLCTRADLQWLGAYAPAQMRPQRSIHPAVLLLDGDDPAVERGARRPRLPLPGRVYFYRRPQVDSLRHCMEHGARGCLDKLAPPQEVLRALGAVDAGLFAVEPALLRLAIEMPSVAVEPPPASDAVEEGAGPFPLLTARQREIVRYAVQGLSNKQIARALGISPETVKTHLHNIYEREGMHHRIDLLTTQRTGR